MSFWETVLGFTERRDDHGGGLGILVRDSVEVTVRVADGSVPGAERQLAESASCRLQVTGIDELYAVCSDAGVVHPRAAIADKPWRDREFGISNPDGNLVTLYQELHD